MSTAAGTVRTISIQTDSKAIFGGKFEDFDGNSVGNICRINSDGTYDNTFSTGAGLNGIVYATALQSDGKVIVAGEFSEYDGNAVNNIVRINPDGSWDENFTLNDDAEISGRIYGVAVQSDGKIIVGGSFSVQGSPAATNFTRLNSDGSLDATFDSEKGLGFDSVVRSVALQADQKIIVGGGFGSFDGDSAPRIARVNTDGSLDSTFTSQLGTGADALVRGVAVQADQKIIAVGELLNFNGASTPRIVRINSDGTRDTAFTTNNGIGFEGFVSNVAVQPNGQIVVGGSFVRFNGFRARQVARLNSSGTGDSTFNANIDRGANATVYSVAVRSDGVVLIGGDFNFFNYRGWVDFSTKRRFEDGVWREV